MDFNSTEYPISWFRDMYRDGKLQIRPPYQRKPVWAARQKCYLIESILLRLPVPEIYIQQTTSAEGETTYAIVDGQQRIRTLLQFVGSEIDPGEKEYNKFVLDKLDPNSRWVNKTFASLSEVEKRNFYGYKFSVRSLNTENEDDVRDMFRRLNKFLTPLKPQELRNATYTGPFVNLVSRLADNEYWVQNRIVTTQSIRRMGDVEFISELLIGVLHGPQGGSASDIDLYYAQYEDYEDEFPEQRKAQRLFDATLKTVQTILPDIKDTRWGNKTDFYTLFVALAALLRSGELSSSRTQKIAKTLIAFAREIDRRVADEEASVSKEAIRYVRAVQKGANDKKRRADRHVVLTGKMASYFRSKKSTP